MCEAPAAARWKTRWHEVNSSRPVSRSCCGWSATQPRSGGSVKMRPMFQWSVGGNISYPSQLRGLWDAAGCKWQQSGLKRGIRFRNQVVLTSLGQLIRSGKWLIAVIGTVKSPECLTQDRLKDLLTATFFDDTDTYYRRVNTVRVKTLQPTQLAVSRKRISSTDGAPVF